LHLYNNIFEIEIIYEEECKNAKLDYEKYARMDYRGLLFNPVKIRNLFSIFYKQKC